MESNKILKILLVIFIILTIALGGFIVYDKFITNNINNASKDNIDDNTSKENVSDDNKEQEKGTIHNIIIKNIEVSKLYKYLQIREKSFKKCFGDYYLNPISNYTIANKISVVLLNYGYESKKPLDEEFYKRLTSEINSIGEYFIEASVAKTGIKKIFDIDVDEINPNNNYYPFVYNEEAEAFILMPYGGEKQATTKEQIIEYKELDNEINVTVVRADLGLDGNVYRNITNESTIVYDESVTNFEFTLENIDKFPQIKYVFRKNNSGNYYLHDIVNLNYHSDFANCQ